MRGELLAVLPGRERGDMEAWIPGTQCSDSRRAQRMLLTVPRDGRHSVPLTPAPPRPSPLGRGRMVRRLAIKPTLQSAQRPSAKHQSVACCSLSLKERVRVRGKNSVRHAKCSVFKRLLSNGIITQSQSLVEPSLLYHVSASILSSTGFVQLYLQT